MTSVIKITGGHRLSGNIPISGAKNAALPLLVTTLLTDQPITFTNVPALSDVACLKELLSHIGTVVTEQGPNTLTFQTQTITHHEAPYDFVKKMRASILVLGPLLARHGYAHVSMPGGCAIGVRPIDIHLDGLTQMGAIIDLKDGYLDARAPSGLKGADIHLAFPSVTGTENLLLAATLAKGTTILRNAAREPEIVDLANCLRKMGAKIQGDGHDTITIEGVETLSGAQHMVIPDRIETGTYIMAAAITHGQLVLEHTSLKLLPGLSHLMEKIGISLTEIENPNALDPYDHTVHVHTLSEKLAPHDITTEPYPGFPTDLQAQYMALMTQADGTSVISEHIWENRFMHVAELHRMNADIQIQGSTAIVKGPNQLKGAPVMATDLRASVCLVLAGLAAEGETTIDRLYHLDRGYENLEAKLRSCGAHIERVTV